MRQSLIVSIQFVVRVHYHSLDLFNRMACSGTSLNNPKYSWRTNALQEPKIKVEMKVGHTETK